MKLQHLKAYLGNARARAKRDKVPFDLVLEDLVAIATDECPIFHTKFVWGASGLGKGKTRENTPQLDRIQPELGYVRGNIAFLSHRANRLKDEGTMQEHYDIADWIWSHTHAKQNTATPVPARSNIQGDADSQRRAVLAARLGEDRDNAHHHCGTIHREDVNHRAQTGSGDSLGHGSEKVGASKTLESFKDYWESRKTTGWP